MVRSIPFRNSENSYSYFRKKLCLMILYESELLFYLDIIVNLKTRNIKLMMTSQRRVERINVEYLSYPQPQEVAREF